METGETQPKHCTVGPHSCTAGSTHHLVYVYFKCKQVKVIVFRPTIQKVYTATFDMFDKLLSLFPTKSASCVTCFRQRYEQCQRNQCLPVNPIQYSLWIKKWALAATCSFGDGFSQSSVLRMIFRLCSLSASWSSIFVKQLRLIHEMKNITLGAWGPGPAGPVG